MYALILLCSNMGASVVLAFISTRTMTPLIRIRALGTYFFEPSATRHPSVRCNGLEVVVVLDKIQRSTSLSKVNTYRLECAAIRQRCVT